MWSVVGEDVAALDHVWRDGGSCDAERRGPQYVHVDVCMILKEGVVGAGEVEEGLEDA